MKTIPLCANTHSVLVVKEEERKKENPIIFRWVLKTALVTEIELPDLRFFLNGWGGIRVFVRLQLTVLSQGCGIHF